MRLVEDHLIIRTTFGPPVFPYDRAFTDKWTSKDDVGVLAPRILAAARSPFTGILNIGTERKTLYDYATRPRPASPAKEIRPIRLKDLPEQSPRDTSFDLSRWDEAIREGKIKIDS